MNSLYRVKLAFEWTEDDVMHDLFIKRLNTGKEIRRIKASLKRVYILSLVGKRFRIPHGL